MIPVNVDGETTIGNTSNLRLQTQEETQELHNCHQHRCLFHAQSGLCVIFIPMEDSHFLL